MGKGGFHGSRPAKRGRAPAHSTRTPLPGPHKRTAHHHHTAFRQTISWSSEFTRKRENINIVVLHLIVCENHLSMTPIVTMFVIYFKVFGVNSAFAGSNVSAVMMLTSGMRRMLMRSCPHLYLPAFPGSARGRCYYKPSHLPPSPLIQAFALHSVCELH